MAIASSALAALALVAALSPHPGMYLAIALSPVALACGWLGWHHRRPDLDRRLFARIGVYAATLALVAAVGRYAVTWAAIAHLRELL